MNHVWQQPIRPLEILISPNDDPNPIWSSVLFVRPLDNGGWEVITCNGVKWNDRQTIMRCAE